MTDSTEVICPYCGNVLGTLDTLKDLANNLLDLDGTAIGILPKKRDDIDFDKIKRAFFDIVDRARNSMQEDDKKLEEANAWIDMKCSRCKNMYRFNSQTGEVRK